MTDSTIFTEETPPVEPVVQNPSANIELPPEVSEYVGDGKKYKTLQDALKSIPHAQTYIQKLEKDLEDAKTEAAKAIAMDELLEEIRKRGSEAVPLVSPQATPQATTPPVDINKAVEEALSRKEAQRIAATNRQAVINAFQQAYGTEGEAYYLKLAQENNMPLEVMNQLAITSPEAVLKLAGIKKAPASVPKPSSSVNTEALNNTQQTPLSAKVPLVGATTKDVTNAWRNAGLKVQQNLK